MAFADCDNHVAATARYNLSAMIKAVAIEQYQIVALPEAKHFAEMSCAAACDRDFRSCAQRTRMENSWVHDGIISYADSGRWF